MDEMDRRNVEVRYAVMPGQWGWAVHAATAVSHMNLIPQRVFNTTTSKCFSEDLNPRINATSNINTMYDVPMKYTSTQDLQSRRKTREQSMQRALCGIPVKRY